MKRTNLKHIKIDDEGELSEWTLQRLKEAEKTPDSEYIPHEEVVREHRKRLHARIMAPKSSR